jgi:hypothetical protein
MMMAIVIDLPPEVEEEFNAEAGRIGVSASERGAFLLELATALTRDGRKTRFREVVRAYLQQRSVEADRLADVVEALMTFCLRESDSDQSGFNEPGSRSTDSGVPDRVVVSWLRDWRLPEAHRSVEENVDFSTHELPPLESLIQRAGRMRRLTAMGKYAHLGGGSEEFMREKQIELDREEPN